MQSWLPKSMLSVAVVLFFSPILFAQGNREGHADQAKTAAPAPKHDINGMWTRVAGDPDLSSIHSLTGVARGPSYVDMPPLTPWGQAKFDANKPGYGIRQQPEGNDPVLRCMPEGVPRIIWRGFEFVQLPNKVLQLEVDDGVWREIATDGKPLEIQDPILRYDTGWMGKSTAHWEDDYTFVIESAGFNDKSWLSEEGLPHSDEMKFEERYTRVDHDTLVLNAMIDDPKTYTKVYKVQPVTYKLGRDTARVATFCNIDNEDAFQQRIRSQAVKTPGADGNVH